MKTSESTKEISVALAMAQVQIRNPTLNKINPHFKSKYADLPEVRDAFQKEISKHGLSIVQTVAKSEDQWVLVTRLMHVSGEWIQGEMPLLYSADRNAMQSFCSAITYARRYSWVSMLGICADEDDDGNSSGKREQKQEVRPAESQKQRAPEPERTIENPIDNESLDMLVSDLMACNSGAALESLRSQAAASKANMNNEQLRRVGAAVNDAMKRLGVK